MTSRQAVTHTVEPGRTRLASRAEVAAYLDVSPATLERWAYRRVGPPYRIVGKYAKYAWPDVDAWLAEQKSGGGVA